LKARMGCRNNDLLHLDNATDATGDHSNRPPPWAAAAAAGEVSFSLFHQLFASFFIPVEYIGSTSKHMHMWM
jgi:hypothetical protein